MSNENKLIPELRFPEFENEGDWQKKPLEDVLQFQTGFPFDSEGFNEEGRGVRLIKNRDLKSDDKIVHYSKPYDEKYLVTNGDVLVGMDGDFTPIKWNKGVALLNQRVGRVLTNQKGDELFFLYFLSIHLKAIEEKTARTTVKHLSHSVVEKINEPIPNPKEQQKIASCLSSLDEVIAAHSQKLELLKDHKKGIMQNLFPQEGEKVPKYRFKEFEKEEEWQEFVLSEITEAIFDGTHQTPSYTESGIPFFSVENIVSGNKNKFISKEDYETSTNKNKPEKGDVLLTRIGKIGFSAIVDWEYKFSIYVTLACIKQSKHFNSYYLHSYFQSSIYQKEIFSKSLLNAVPMKINMEELRKTKVLLPPDKEKIEQQKIASCLSSLDALITAQAEKIEQLKLHKKGLMQGLFPKINE